MVKKKITLGVMAAVGGIAALPGCKDNPASRHYNRSRDSVRLEARLLELSKTEYKGKLSYGAMCYLPPSPPTDVDYVCPYCNDTIRGKYNNWEMNGLHEIDSIVDSIKAKGYDALLDKSELCPNCSGKDIAEPVLTFKIRFSEKADYHTARSNNISEYLCVKNFIEGRDVYPAGGKDKHAIHDNINIIQKMLGLGRGIETPEIEYWDNFGVVPPPPPPREPAIPFTPPVLK